MSETCRYCNERPVAHDEWLVRNRVPGFDLCSVCRDAQHIVSTSVDDAKHTVANAGMDVVSVALQMESSKQQPRVSVLKMLNGRLRKLER